MGARDMARRKKSARHRKAWIILQDESGISERPLGPARPNAGPDSCLQLEEDVHLCRARLPVGWQALTTLVPNEA